MDKLKSLILFGLILMLLLVLAGCPMPPPVPPPVIGTGNITGLVTDANASPSPIVNATLTLYNRNGQPVVAGSTDTNGRFDLTANAGVDYRLDITMPGCLTVNYYSVAVFDLRTTALGTIAMVDSSQAGKTGFVTGKLINLFNGKGVYPAQIEVLKGMHVRHYDIGMQNPFEAPKTDTSGGYGFYYLTAGHWTARVTSLASNEFERYDVTYFDILVLAGVNTTIPDITLVPQVKDPNELRAVLTWGAAPSDLDSHMTGPKAFGDGAAQDYSGPGRFHTFYVQREYKYGNTTQVRLDVDDTTSFGPETTCIYHRSPGLYKFIVHNYSAQFDASDNSLATSGAMVRVFRGRNLIATYNVPVTGMGTVWEVFTWDGTTLVPLNTFPTGYDDETEIRSFRGPVFLYEYEKLFRNLPPK